MEQAVAQVVCVMRDRYHERLYVPELAARTYFSPFHFSRIFRRDTGVTPGQYLTAVRLFEAKRLLLNTSLSVADVACQVGYPGVGTFTTRFTRLVGVSPGHYRRLPPGQILSITDDVARLPIPDWAPAGAWQRQSRAFGCGGTIVGSVHIAPAGQVSRLLVGVFDDPIPQGPPVIWELVRGTDSARWRLDGLPTGQWTIIAVAEGLSADGMAIFAGMGGPVQVNTGAIVRVDLELRRPQRTDPPIMVPLSDHVAERDLVEMLAA
jgi:AraC-like DNA-binding protein